MTQADQQPAPMECGRGVRISESWVDRDVGLTTPSRVAHMNDHISDRVVVEGTAASRRKAQRPSGSDSGTLEWQVALVAEVKLEHTAVGLTAASGDRLCWQGVAAQRCAVFRRDRAAKERQGGWHTTVGSHYAGYRQAYGLDAAEVVVAEVLFEHGLGHRERTFAAGPQAQQGLRTIRQLAQGNVLGDFKIALVAVHVGDFHA